MPNSVDSPRPWATATDAKATTWIFRVTLRQALDLRAKKTVDLLGTDVAKAAMEASKDPVLMVELAYYLTADQRATLGEPIADDLAFMDRFDGDTWGDLIDATMEALIDFIPPQQRPALQKLWGMQKAATARGNQHIVQKVAGPEMMDQIDAKVTKALADFDRELRESGPTIRS